MTMPASDGKEHRGGVFVLSNVTMPEESLPFQISDGIVLRAAGDEEVIAFEKALEATYRFVGSPAAAPTLKYRGEVIVLDAGKLELSDNGCEGRCRFWVFAYPNGWQVEHMVSLCKVGMLTNPQLILGFRYLCKGPSSCGCILSHAMPYSRFSADRFEPHQAVTKEQLELFRKLFRQIHVDRSIPSDLQSCLEDYRSTIRFYRGDHMLTLLYFALIESRITHQPDPKDPTDSLTSAWTVIS